jgi:DNA-binding NtrC family response regulator
MRGEHGDQTTAAIQPVVDLSPKPEAVFRVTVLEGADAGASVVIDGAAEVLVGQSPVCGLKLTDPTVSRRHLALEVVGATLRARDLGSSNGTYAGDLQLVEAMLRGGESLLLGATRVRVDREALAKPSPQSTEIRFGEVFGVSREMRRLYPLLNRLAAIDVPVLVEGETGTGKELVARALHEHGKRAAGPFVVLDCTAISATLVESELFGHERGAFTGAASQRKGVFEQAHGGTLFIDEIGDLPLDMQPKLLRALERSEVRRVGGSQWIQCDVRVVAATRRDVEELVEEQRFRDDLFHRLSVARVELPPLRRRRGDILALVDHFCKELDGDPRSISGPLLSEWSRAAWPGNVRELHNAVTRELALGDLNRMSELTGEHVAANPAGGAEDFESILALDLPFVAARTRVVEAFQRRYLERVLAAHGGNAQRAAQASGIAPRYFRLLRARSRE